MLFVSLYVALAVACSGPSSAEPPATTAIHVTHPCDSIPELNKKIKSYVIDHLKKKVGRGECWDLAAEPLRMYQANWDGKFNYGKLLDYKNDCVFPGDILQFEKVRIETVHENGYTAEEMPHHTAIVYEVHDTGQYTIAHQNYNNTRKVILTPLDMANVKRGSIKIYRPQL